MAIEPTRNDTTALDIEENAKQIKEALESKGDLQSRMQDLFKKSIRFRETEILRELYAKEGRQFPPKDTKSLDHDRELANEARRLYELEMTEADRQKEREQIAAWATELKNLSTGAFNWINFLKSRELWQMLQNETQKEMVFRSYYSISGDMEFTALALADLLQYYPDLEEYYKRNELLDYFTRARNGLMFGIDILPFYIEEYAKPIYGGKCPADLWEEAEKDGAGQPVEGSLYMRAEEAAIAAFNKAWEPKEKTKKINPQPLEKLLLLKDKVNSKIWNLPDTGNIEASFDIIKQSRKKRALVAQYSINFDFLDDNIKHRLTPFDKRVFTAAATLFLNGETEFSFTRLYYAIGGKTGTKPTTDALSKLYNALAKLGAVRTWLALPKEKGSKYNEFEIKNAALLDFELDAGGAVVKGGEANIKIVILRKPRLVEFAENLGQITCIDLKLYQDIELNLTDDNLALEDYILNFISWQKHDKNKSAELTLATICEKNNMTDRRQKARTATKTETILKSCKRNNFISGYKYDTSTKKFIISL